MSDTAQRVLIWCVAVALVVGTALALKYARGYRPLAGFGSSPAASALPPEIGIRLEGVRIVGRNRGARQWTLSAKRVDTTRARDRIEFSGGIDAKLLPDPTGKRPAATLSARTATYNTAARFLSLSGAIVGRTAGYKIRTEALIWDDGAEVVRAPGAVVLSYAEGQIAARRVEVNMRTKSFSATQIQGRSRLTETNPFPGLTP